MHDSSSHASQEAVPEAEYTDELSDEALDRSPPSGVTVTWVTWGP